MLKLIKYELIGKYKAFGILVAIAVILNLALMSRRGIWPDAGLVAMSLFIAGLVSVVLLVWCIGLFSQDLYEDKGYLTYILPQKGYAIVGSKIIVSLIAYIIIEVIAGLFVVHFILTSSDIKMQIINIAIMPFITKIFFISLIGTCILAVSLLVNIYFSISLTRMAITQKRGGKFAAFIVFIVISIITGLAANGLQHLFPQTVLVDIINGNFSTSIINFQSNTTINGVPINIATSIFQFILFWIFLFLTCYIVENKVDL